MTGYRSTHHTAQTIQAYLAQEAIWEECRQANIARAAECQANRDRRYRQQQRFTIGIIASLVTVLITVSVIAGMAHG